MKLIRGWRPLEFAQFATLSADRPQGEASLRCVELENVSPGTGRLLGWREGRSDEGSKVSFLKNDVLFAKLRPYLRKSWLAVFDGMCSGEFWVLRTDPKVCDNRFLQQLTLSDLFFRATFASSGSKMPRADWSLVAEYPFQLPPHLEQIKIADILGSWDEALEKLDALIAAKDRRKKTLMQQLLTGKHCLRKRPGRWTRRPLGELVEPIVRTVKKPTAAFLAAGIRSHGRGVFLKPSFEPGDIALDELFQIKKDDLIVNITFAWEGAVTIVPPEADGALVSHRFPTFRVRESEAALSFLRHYILTQRFVFDCGLASPGGAGRNRVLSKTSFLEIELSVPSAVEQQEIGSILDDADTELRLLRKQRAARDQQKRGLMQQLLTGRKRVKTN